MSCSRPHVLRGGRRPPAKANPPHSPPARLTPVLLHSWTPGADRGRCKRSVDLPVARSPATSHLWKRQENSSSALDLDGLEAREIPRMVSQRLRRPLHIAAPNTSGNAAPRHGVPPDSGGTVGLACAPVVAVARGTGVRVGGGSGVGRSSGHAIADVAPYSILLDSSGSEFTARTRSMCF